jgi:hypothetical protein
MGDKTAVVPVSVALELPVPLETGVAGASLQGEYERRSRRRQERIRAKHPRIGGLLLAITDEPTSTRAFKIGAAGEQRAAKRVQELCHRNVLFLLNRRLGLGRRDGDVDMVAVGPAGVFVIDVKHYKGKKVEVRRSGGLFSAVKEQLFIGGRDKTGLLDSMARQLDAVRSALLDFPGGDRLPVSTALCFVDADLPLFSTPLIGGVPCLGPKQAAKLVSTAGVFNSSVRAALHEHLACRLPPAR